MREREEFFYRQLCGVRILFPHIVFLPNYDTIVMAQQTQAPP